MNLKKIAVIIFIFTPVIIINAQDKLEDAKLILEFSIKGQGDSIYARSNETIRQHVSAEIFGSTFKMLEEQFGMYVSAGEWKNGIMQNLPYYYTDLQFENTVLRFTVAFDDTGKIQGINFAPTQPQAKSYELINNEKIKEELIEVVTGEYKLPGILTLPVGKQNPPVAILVHGSGANDRDETVGPNKPFRELATGLAERGIAVIRYDKRTLVYGMNSSPEGKINPDDETVLDALSAMKIAQDHEQLAQSKIYIIGHSQGALFAPRMAELNPRLSGIVMIAGNARPLEDVLIDQYEYLSTFPESGLTEKHVTELKEQVANLKKIGTNDFDSSIAMPLNAPEYYWKEMLKYKQLDVAKKLNLPVFVIQGERDYQVTMEDYEMWNSAFRHNEKATFKSYPKLNHILHEGTGKATPGEYSLKGSIPDYVMDDIANWLLSL